MVLKTVVCGRRVRPSDLTRVPVSTTDDWFAIITLRVYGIVLITRPWYGYFFRFVLVCLCDDHPPGARLAKAS